MTRLVSNYHGSLLEPLLQITVDPVTNALLMPHGGREEIFGIPVAVAVAVADLEPRATAHLFTVNFKTEP